MAKAERIDKLIHQRGLTTSREKARRLIMAGEVLVDGQRVDKPGARVDPEAEIRIKERPPYVGRGGYKLAEALELFPIDIKNCIAADVGASTGGFTDVMLQAGAARVYAIDVGYGQLAWKLRQDPRVVVMERTNARYLESLPEPIDFASVDVSFISLDLILPRIHAWLRPGGQAVALIKPQFEAGADKVGKGGVVRKSQTHREVLMRVITDAMADGWKLLGLIRSPITGPAGNIEFLAWLGTDPDAQTVALQRSIEDVLS